MHRYRGDNGMIDPGGGRPAGGENNGLEILVSFLKASNLILLKTGKRV